MAAWLGPAIAAGASLLGGFLGKSSQEKQQQQNAALQKEFAQSSIQWKVEDAKKAGIHPLYALGSPSISPAVSVQGDPVAKGISDAGQDISRAMLASASHGSRTSALSEQAATLQLENMALQNQLLASRINRLNSAQIGPAIPDPAPGDATSVPVDDKLDRRNRIVLGGQEVRGNPRWSPANAIQDEYGEWGENLYSLPKILADWLHHRVTDPRQRMEWIMRGPEWVEQQYEREREARRRREGRPAGRYRP